MIFSCIHLKQDLCSYIEIHDAIHNCNITERKPCLHLIKEFRSNIKKFPASVRNATLVTRVIYTAAREGELLFSLLNCI